MKTSRKLFAGAAVAGLALTGALAMILRGGAKRRASRQRSFGIGASLDSETLS
jgi:hypothetical protein